MVTWQRPGPRTSDEQTRGVVWHTARELNKIYKMVCIHEDIPARELNKRLNVRKKSLSQDACGQRLASVGNSYLIYAYRPEDRKGDS